LRITFYVSPAEETCLTSTRCLAAYYFWYFAAIGVSEPYLTPFWRSLGFSSAELGLLSAIAPGVAAIAPFLWTAYADATRQGERIFLWNTWAAALTAFFLPNLRAFLPVALAVLVYSTFRMALIPLANSMVFRALAGHRQGYAGIRLWGTVGYIVVAVAAGAGVDRLGLRAGIYGIALSMLACAVAAWLGRRRERVSLPPVSLVEFLQVLRRRPVVLFLVASGLAQMSYGPYSTFFTIHLERLGFSKSFAGSAWALAAGSELIVMLLWPRLCTLATARTWLTAALAMHALRWGLSVIARGPVFLMAVQLTHAFTFGVFYLASVQTVDALAPEGLRATAQGVFASITFGVSGVFGSILGGLGYESLGMERLYAVASILAATATTLYWAGTRPPAGPRRRLAVHPSGDSL
jgi:MFS transporter, PPP family, 3-phenylpropionic acid transporter